MELNGLRIAIIGAGIGGLAAARALALRGARVTVLEQAPEIREVGAGLQISPNGFAVLRGLGLSEAALEGSVRAGSVNLYDYRGGHLTTFDLEPAPSQEFQLFHRADLIDLLHDAAVQVGARILLLQKVSRVEGGAAPVVHLASGAEVHCDLVIGADGLHSCVRAELNGASTPFFTRQVAWRAVVPNVSGRVDDVQLHMAPHRHLVTYPLRGGSLINVVAVQERAAWAAESWSQKDDPVALHAAFGDFASDMRALLDQIETVHLWGLFRHPVAGTWARDGLCLLGDAAHPTLPFMAQGANLALEDAWVLGAELSKATDVASALAAYQKARATRATRIVNTATGNARKYHLAFPPLRWAAHSVMRMGGRMAPARMMGQFDWIYGEDVTGGEVLSPQA